MIGDADRLMFEVFFGPVAPERWAASPAHAALGLDAGARVSSDIAMAALQHRMAVLEAHPMNGTVQAGHVRRILNTAASAVLLSGSSVPPRLPTIAASSTSATPANAPGLDAVPVAPPARQSAATPAPSIVPIERPVPAPASAEVQPPRHVPPESAADAVPSNASAPPPQPFQLAGFTPESAVVLLREARQALGRHGGFSPEFMHELTLVLAGRGVPQSMTVDVINQLIAGLSPSAASSQRAARSIAQSPSRNGADAPRTQSAAPAHHAATTAEPAQSEHDVSPQRVKSTVLLIAAGSVAFVGAGVGLMLVLAQGQHSTAPTPTPPPVIAPTDAPVAAPTPFKPPAELRFTPPKPGESLAAAEIIKRLNACSERFSDAPDDAAKSAAIAIDSAKHSWDVMAAGERTAVAEAIVDVVFKSATTPAVNSVLASVTTPVSLHDRTQPQVTPEQVKPAVFSAGVLWRLSRERDLPAEVYGRIQDALRTVFGPMRPAGAPGFAGGVAAALRLVPIRTIAGASQPPPAPRAMMDALETWKAVVVHVAQPVNEGDVRIAGAPTAEALIADALDQIMLDDLGPTAGQATFNAVSLLARSMKWEIGDPSRPRLISWLADPRVSTGKLATLTSVLVNRVKLDGLDPSYIISINASTEERSAIREAYVALWNVAAGPATIGSTQQVLQAARTALAEPIGESGDDLTLLVMAAQLNQAIALRSAGHVDESRGLLESLVTPAPIYMPLNPEVEALVSREAGGEDSWASKYLNGDRALVVRLQRIREIADRAPNITQLDADVLVEAAFGSSPPELSSAAIKAIAGYSPSPMVTHAMLKMLPRVPRREAIARAIASHTFRPVSHATGSRWMIDARKALVERLLEQIAGQSFGQRMDRACVQIADAYQTLTSATRPPVPAEDQAAAALHAHAETLYATLRAQAGLLVPSTRLGFSIDAIDRRRESRRLVCIGPIQSFAAEQVSIFEMLAYIAASERPDNAEAIAELVAKTGDRRAKAENVLSQVRIVEQSIARLNLSRLGLSLSTLP